jgi:hypothetical protein
MIQKKEMTQSTSKLFPKDHETFVDEKILQKKIKSLEDRIEQSYQVHQLRQSLLAIAEIIESPPVPERNLPIHPDLLACFDEILKDAPPPTQLDKDRDAIWEMVRRSGKLYVLAFLSHKLWQSLEVLFTGIVVSYIQMFSGGDSRSMLDYSRVFKDNAALKAAHEKFGTLRNKQYAHKEFEDDRHQISYFVDNQGAIAIDANGAQHTKHYHISLCKDLLQCLAGVSSYLKQDIKERSEGLINNLTENQKLFLFEYAKTTQTQTQTQTQT